MVYDLYLEAGVLQMVKICWEKDFEKTGIFILIHLKFKIMTRKKYIIFLLCGWALFTACDKESVTEKKDAEEVTVHEDSTDYFWDGNDIVYIEFKGSSITTTSPEIARINGNTVTINSAGVYRLSGILTNGQVIVNTQDEDKVVLILNGTDITNTTNAPLYIEKSEKTIIYLEENTENTLTDATTYTYSDSNDDEVNAALFSKSDLTIFGKGSLRVNANYKDGITSKDGLIIADGNISVNAADDGIRGKDYLIIEDGNLSLTATGDGLKSDNEDNASAGYIAIQTGKITIVAGGDAIAASTHTTIMDGEFAITSGGGSNKIMASTLSAKGIKGGQSRTIKGGTFTLNSADDGLHTNGKLNLSSGNITVL